MGLAENRSARLLTAPGGLGRSARRFVGVGLAGAVGSVARDAIGLTINRASFPWATLGTNLSGSLVLGFFLTVALGQLPVRVVTPIAVALIGGFTTSSTFAWDGFTIGRGGRVAVAALYVVLSVVGGSPWPGPATSEAAPSGRSHCRPPGASRRSRSDQR